MSCPPGYSSCLQLSARLTPFPLRVLQAEELNTIVGNAFRMAYAARLQRSCLRTAGGTGEPSAWDLDGRNNHDKTNNRTWVSDDRLSSQLAGKTVCSLQPKRH